MDVSVIMINYNTFDFTQKAIESVFHYTKNLSYEVILVDNSSPDGSGEKLKEFFGDKIQYIQANDNLGFGRANNLGCKSATGKYFLFLNSDTEMRENFIYTLFDYMEKNQKCGICGGNLLSFDGKPTHSYLTPLPSLTSYKKENRIIYLIMRKLRLVKSDQYNTTGKPKPVGYITGADMMIRKEIFDRLGGFDEDIFMYYEETELTYRMKQMTDYSVMSVPAATLYHFGGGSFGKKQFSERRFTNQIDGNTLYFEKSYGRKSAIQALRIRSRLLKRLRLLNVFLLRLNKAKDCKKMKQIIDIKIHQLAVNA